MQSDGTVLAPTVVSLGSEMPSNALSPEAHQFKLLDHVMTLPGAHEQHYLVVRKLLTSKTPLEDFTLGELCRIARKGRSTVSELKCWLVEHGILTMINDLINTGQFFGPWDVERGTEQNLKEEKKDNNHSPIFWLCVELLKEMGWGMRGKRELFNPVRFVRRFGEQNVLYAIWCAKGKRIKNPAAFITWQLTVYGIEAPDGWEFPIPAVDEKKESSEQRAIRLTMVEIVERAEEKYGSNYRDPLTLERLRKRYTGQYYLRDARYDMLVEYKQFLLLELLKREEHFEKLVA